MSNGVAAAYTVIGVRQMLGEMVLTQPELDQLGTLLDLFKARRQALAAPPQRDYTRHPLRAVKSYLNAKYGMEVFDDGGLRIILRNK